MALKASVMFIGRYGYESGESCITYAYFMQKEALNGSRRLTGILVAGSKIIRIYVLFGGKSFITFSNEPKFDALDMDVICNTSLMSYILIEKVGGNLQNDVNCSKNYKEFQLVYTNANRTSFYAGIYSTVSPREIKVLVATVSGVPMENAGELEVDTTSVEVVPNFMINSKPYVHPDCKAKEPTLELDKCPTDSDPPTVYITPGHSSIYVHRHDDVTLECSFLSFANIASFKWIKHGQTGQTILDELTNFSGVSHSVPLVVFDFIPEDVGFYQCKVSNENGENDDKVSMLIIEETPDPQIPLKKYPLNLGGDVHLECMIDVYPEVTDVWWAKDDGLIDKTDSRYSGSTPQEPSLNISTTTTDDIGYYRCCANNSIGFSCSKSIVFGYMPIITNYTHYAEGFLGKPFNITCEVKSAPRILDVKLQLKGKIIEANVFNVSTGNHQEKFTFTITNPTLQDSGNYTCNATNVHTSSISDAITLEIYGVIFDEHPDENVTFGEDISIDCAVNSHPPITQLTTITWSLNGSCININNTTKYLQPTPTELTIKHAGFSDQGTYTCAVENDYGNETSGGLWLNVIGDFPSVNSILIYDNVLHSAIVSVNESSVSTLILTCSYESFPPATDIKWEKQNGIYKPLSERATGGNSIDPNITFTSIEKSDEGNYTCLVTNAVGKGAGNSVYIQVNESLDMCTCQCSFKEKINFWKKKNFTREEMLAYMEPSLKKVLDEMKIEKDKLSQSIRKRTSAKDGRKSSTQIGIAGVVFIGATFGLIIVIDCISIKRYVQNVREAFNIT
ncbi:hemicentin-1-like [Mytilus trossulus]|uniref:hemicentin-1-like n=1 Tax=Mytilus trossulus TaxID=6551 RepID=UPI0030060FE4